LRHYKSTLLVLLFYFGALALALAPLVALPAVAFLPQNVHVLVTVALVAFSLLVGPLILYVIVPRESKPDLDGIAMNPVREPALFRLFRSVAKRTRQAMPSLVLINSAPHASTGFYSGFAGFGSQRVLSLGLPYFAVMSVNELSALLAHEMGHFYRGSMFRWAWIVETQRAIGRFFQELERHTPRLIPLFGRLLTPFVKACLEVSREQELAADRFAAEHFGADTLRQAIEKTRHLEHDYGLYFQSEVVPVLYAGLAPPLLDGFAAYRERVRQGAAPPRLDWAVKSDGWLDPATLAPVSPDFLTHPDFETRMHAIRSDGWRNAAPDERPALVLLEERQALETRLLNWEAQKRGLPRPQPIAWSDVGPRVYLPQWRATALAQLDVLHGSQLRDLPHLVRTAGDWGGQIAGASTEEQRLLDGVRFLCAATCAALDGEGWRLALDAPGAPRAFVKNGQRCDPFDVIGRLAAEEMASFEWEDMADELGVAALPLAATSASPAG